MPLHDDPLLEFTPNPLDPTRSRPIRYLARARFPLENFAPFADLGPATTVSNMLLHAVAQFGPQKCLGFRYILEKRDVMIRRLSIGLHGKHTSTNAAKEKRVSQTRLSAWEWWTYDEVGKAVRKCAVGLRRALREVGLPLVEDAAAREGGWGRVYMFADTSPQWFMVCHGASLAGMPIVGVNIRLGETHFVRTVNESRPTVLFTDARSLPQLLAPLVECPTIRLVVFYLNSKDPKDTAKCRLDVEAIWEGLQGTVNVMSFDDLLRLGTETPDRPVEELAKPDPRRVWGIIYPQTHLHRQPPQQVIFLHKNVLASVGSIMVEMRGQWNKDDAYLTHLPMYSMLEFSLLHAVLMVGLPVGFATQTEKFLLSAPFDGSALWPGCEGDFVSFQPTITYGIMPWWAMVFQHIIEWISEKTPKEEELFWTWLERKRFLLRRNLPFGPTLRLADKKSGIIDIRRALLGDRIQWIGNHCSRMPKQLREFLGLVLGGENGIMVEGWTIMELNTIVTFMSPRLHNPLKGLGRPMPSVEIVLRSSEGKNVCDKETGYITGRVWIGGPSVPTVYPTIETRHGGRWDPKLRSFQVVRTHGPLLDRFLGDYVPVQDLEAVICSVPFVEDAVLAHRGRRMVLIGILSVREEALRKFAAASYKIQSSDLLMDELLLLGGLKERVVKHLRKVGRKQGCAGFELLDKVVMINGRFTQENGLRLKSGEVDRKKVLKSYEDEILYEAA